MKVRDGIEFFEGKILTSQYPLFKTLKKSQFPRAIVFVRNVTAVCLKEAGIIR